MPLSRSPLKRKPMKVTRPVGGGPTVEVVESVIVRATRDGVVCCELCADPIFGERGIDWAIHHRRGRDGRPDSHTVQNALLVHGRDNVTACHGRIHRNREGEASRFGWLISRNALDRDPLQIPALVDNGTRWVYLTHTGEYADAPESAA